MWAKKSEVVVSFEEDAAYYGLTIYLDRCLYGYVRARMGVLRSRQREWELHAAYASVHAQLCLSPYSKSNRQLPSFPPYVSNMRGYEPPTQSKRTRRI